MSNAIEPDSPASDSTATASSQATSQAIVPRLIKFSGVLRDVMGKALSGPLDVTFALYDVEAGGDPLWFESQSVQADQLGHYTALLGAMHADGLPVELFTSGEVRWLGIQVGHEQEQQPRVLLVSVPYALKAGDAETLGGKPASAYMLSDSQSAGTSGSGTPSIAETVQAGGSGEKRTKNGAGPLAVTHCSSVTSDGTATANSIAMFTTACNVQNSVISQVSGRVGIGTTTPGQTLDVNGNMRVGGGDIYLQRNLTDQAGRRNWAWGTETFSVGDISMLVSTSNTADPSVPVFTALSNGNVGIGTANPMATLDVEGNVFVKVLNGIPKADQFAGSDFGVKTTACIASLPSGGTNGGTCDARGFVVPQTSASSITVPCGDTLLLPATTITFSGTNGIWLTSAAAGCRPAGGVNRIRGSGTQASVLIAGSGFTGCLIRMEPGTGATSVSDIAVMDIGFDLTAAPTAKAICGYSVRDPSSFHDLRVVGGSGRSIEFDSSTILNGVISQGLHFYDIYDQNAGTQTGDRWLIRANEVTVGPNNSIQNVGTGTYSGLVIDSITANAGRYTGRAVTIIANSIGGWTGPAILMRSGAGAPGPEGIEVAGNRFEGDTQAWKAAGFDSSHVGQQIYIHANYYEASTNAGTLDYVTASVVDESNIPDAAGSITVTGNSAGNQIRVSELNTPADVSDLGAGNYISVPWRFPVAFSRVPACSAAREGETYAVKDSSTATWGATITGSGTNHVLAYCDETNWTVAGM